jgi:hypothetical protein
MSRKPIYLNPHAVALIHIFTKTDKMDDCWMLDTDWAFHDTYKEAAKEFVNQLEGQQCDSFIENLILYLCDSYKESRGKVGCPNDFKKLVEKINKK